MRHGPACAFGVAELLKPITWFPPMWAFGCGVVASGQSLDGAWPGLAGRAAGRAAVCATSQAVNDWFDRHVDAINEPQRPIPSGRMPGRWGLYVAVLWTLLSLLCRWCSGPGALAPRCWACCWPGPTARRRCA
jgi:chlorophyll/bacteriochlorophyll a synthase